MLRVHFSGFYAWLEEPLSLHARDDFRQTELIRQAWFDSGQVYGYRKLTDDLRDQGKQASESRVARLAGLAGILAQVGCKRRLGRYGGKPAVVVSNVLERQFEVDAPNKVLMRGMHLIGADRARQAKFPWQSGSKKGQAWRQQCEEQRRILGFLCGEDLPDKQVNQQSHGQDSCDQPV
jgi:hypothetical protein